MRKVLLALLLLSSPVVYADLTSGPLVWLQDGSGANGITSQSSGGQRALDIGIDVSGTQIDPRSIRALTSSDVVSCVQSTAASASGAWPIKWTDGTNTSAVKAASTAPVATDPAGVVALSPNGNQATSALQTTGNTTLTTISTAQTSGTQKSQQVDASGNVQPSGDVLTRKIFVQPTDGSNNQGYTASNEAKVSVTQPLPAGTNSIGTVNLTADTVGTGSITIQDTGSSTSTGFNNQTYFTGTPTASSFVQFTVTSVETAMVTVTGTWTGTLEAEISTDGGTTWIAHSLHQIGSGSFITQFTGNFQGSLNLAAKNWIRVRAVAAMTGTASIRITQSLNPSSVYVASPVRLIDGSSQTSSTTMNIVAANVSASSSSNTGVVTAIRPDSTMQTFQDKAGTGNMTAQCTTPTSCPANSTVTALTNGSSTVNFTLTNTWVGTVVFEGLDGNSTWQSTIGTVPGNGSPTAASGTPINLSIPSGGFSQVRARCTVFVSGTITANYNVGAGLSTLQVFNLTPSAFMATVTGSGTAGTPSTGVVSVQGVASGTPIVDNLSQIAGNAVNVGIGAAGTGTPRVSVSNDSLIKLWDGTNTAKVVAGSTQSALTDTAVVVTGRPDNVGTPTQTSVSCAGTSTTLLAASTATMFLSIRNPTTATQTVWINVAGSAAVAAAPSIDLSPGSEADFFAEGASFLPTDQINCISGGAASTVTVVYK